MHTLRHAIYRLRGYTAHGKRKNKRNVNSATTLTDRIWLLGGITIAIEHGARIALPRMPQMPENSCITLLWGWGLILIVAIVLFLPCHFVVF